jgi:hypothetical protein
MLICRVIFGKIGLRPIRHLGKACGSSQSGNHAPESILPPPASPSAPRLRQRFDEDAEAIIPLIDAASVEFIASVGAPITALSTGHVALDMDVFPPPR